MMNSEQPQDAVEGILSQWRRERPDLDLEPMATIGRMKRCAELLRRRLDATYADFDMSSWEFDVLATLRRSGPPYRLAPTALFSALMITSGTMTHRLHRLEASNLISRVRNVDDARSVLVQLTPGGMSLIDRAITAHVENERRILSPLKKTDLASLDRSLIRLLAVLEEASPPD